MSRSVLLVDDDRSFSATAAAYLTEEGFSVSVARSLHETRKSVSQSWPDLIVLDRQLPDGDGLTLLPELKAAVPSAGIVLLTAHGDIETAVTAIRGGAQDYLTKPVEMADLGLRVRRGIEEGRLRERLERAEKELGGRRPLLKSKSKSMQELLDVLERIARTPRSPVLLWGETGVGKEVLARHLHSLQQGDGPFVHINCAALPEQIIESELFGHERGAFTDAKVPRKGLVEIANGGVLFLDEIGELPLALQAKLLTFLDRGIFRRLGGNNEGQSSARVVAATNRDLDLASREGSFREDLLFRLSVFKLKVPPLRERRDDLLPLAEALIDQLRVDVRKPHLRLSPSARDRLMVYPFPGNIRELRNLLERALVLEAGPELELDGLHVGGGKPRLASDPFLVEGGPITLDELERRYAAHVLRQLQGKRVEAARLLGISYPTLLKRLGEPSET